MSDDWNLKDKKVTTWATNNVNDTWYTYKDTDIETLRKKLIEDIKNLVQRDIYSIEKIINKRFGIDES